MRFASDSMHEFIKCMYLQMRTDGEVGNLQLIWHMHICICF